MNLSPATLQKAREAGYSDDEILSHVSTADEKIGNAVKAGYSLDEVATHFDEKARFRALEPTTGFTDEERGQAEREAMLEYVREAKPRIPGNIDLGSTDPEFTGTGVAAEPVGGETGLVKPLLSAIGVEGPEGDTTGAGLVRGGISLADSLTTPTNIALMESMVGAPRVIAKAAGAAFLPMMVSGTREGAIAFNRAETPGQAAEAAVGAVGSAAMGALGTFHSGTRAPDVSLDARFLRSLAPMPRLLAESGAPLTAAEVARFEPIPETTVPGRTAQESNQAMPTEAASRGPVESPAPTTTGPSPELATPAAAVEARSQSSTPTGEPAASPTPAVENVSPETPVSRNLENSGSGENATAPLATKPTPPIEAPAPAAKAGEGVAKAFAPDDTLIMHSPHTGEDVAVSYRGPFGDKSVVWTGKSQMAIPTEWLRHEGEPLQNERTRPTGIRGEGAASGAISGVSKEGEIRRGGASATPESANTSEGTSEATGRKSGAVPVAEPLIPTSKQGLIEELLGPRPDTNDRSTYGYEKRVKWDQGFKAFSKFKKNELEERVRDQRVQDKKSKERSERMLSIGPSVKARMESAGNSWRSEAAAIAAEHGIKDYVTFPDNTRGEEAARLSSWLADRGVKEIAAKPTPAEAQPAPAEPPKELTPEEELAGYESRISEASKFLQSEDKSIRKIAEEEVSRNTTFAALLKRESKMPLTAAEAYTYGAPKGYVKEGDLYVYRPDKLSEPPPARDETRTNDGGRLLSPAALAQLSDDQLADRVGAMRIFLQEKKAAGAEIIPSAVENARTLYNEAKRRGLIEEPELKQLSEPPAEAQTTPPAAPATAPPAAREGTGASASEKTAAADAAFKQESLPKQLRTDSDIALVLAGEETGPQMRMGEAPEGGAFGSAGGSRPKVRPAGNTPLGDSEFIRIPSAMQRFGRGLLTEGSADVMAKQRNKVGQMLSRAIRKHVDLEQEISGSMMAEFNQAMRGLSKTAANRALDEITPYLAAKENGRPTPTLSPAAQKILTAWENIAETTGLMAEAHNVQVFDPSTGGHRPMHRMGRSYVPRMFTKEVTRVLQDPASNPTLFNDLADALAVHRGISQADAAALLRQEAGRFQTSDFMGNLEMARTGQLPESFYEYDLRNLASQYLPSFSERMAQIIAYGQRLGPRDTPNRKNLWDVARSEAEDRYSQQWLRDAEDQAVNLRPNSGVMQGTRRLQTLASGLLLSSPTTSVVRNTLSGLSASTELMGVRRSVSNLVKAATDAQTKMDAKEIGAVRDNIGDFLYADQLGDSALDDMVRGVTDVALKYSGYNGSETFVRTHAAATASQFAKDGITAIAKDPSSMRSKEALGLFKRLGVDAKEIVAEGADWKTGPETRKFIRAIIRDSQGGYRFDQVPLWANSAVGRFLYQFGRYGTQRARNIWRNGIQPLIGEDVEWNGKTMTRRDARPLMKMGASAILLGETFALLASGFFGRDRKDASLEEIAQAMTEDQKLAAAMAGERLINDIIMAGTLGIWGQPLDAIKSLKDQSRFKNPFEPPGLSSTKSVIRLATNAMDQGGRVTLRDINDFLGGTAPGIKQAGDVVRNVFDEPLYEAENDVRTLRAAAKRWAMDTKQDVSRRASTAYRKSKNAPEYMAIQEALLVGDSQRAKFLAGKFLATQPDQAKARKALSASIKARQPFRVGPYTSAEHRADFMEWAKTRLPKKDYEQAKRVQDRYEAAAKNAGF